MPTVARVTLSAHVSWRQCSRRIKHSLRDGVVLVGAWSPCNMQIMVFLPGPSQGLRRDCLECQMSEFAPTPSPPYFAVIFTSLRTGEGAGYKEMAERMMRLAAEQPGFLGVESAREDLGITVSYWSSLAAIEDWKRHAAHQVAQRLGKEQWYAAFRVRVARVERDYGSPGSGAWDDTSARTGEP
ncbi:MAG: antibiotic biosynthesis monooxygenase [Pseudomonadota bacterium]|nr:antibiotic biosynthesis monooxygenase [Pseudomonadota bacterium]